jgi:hypothetical protein
MRGLHPTGDPCSRTLAARASAMAAAVALTLVAGGAGLAAAEIPSSSTTSASAARSARSIAEQLAASAAGEPVGACDAESDGSGDASPYLMSVAGGSFDSLPPLPMDGSSPAIAVMCALPYTNGKPGGDCTGKHYIRYQTYGTTPAAVVTAELMGLDSSGNLIQSFLVQNGDTAHLASRLSPADWRFDSKKDEYSISAPVPLVKVTVQDQGQTAVAYCSNIPWVDVVKPSGGVVTEANGNETQVLAAVPLTDPFSLHLYVDGDDLLTDVPNPSGCTYLSPCSGTADINGAAVPYENLVLDIASSISSFSSNTVRVTLKDLACGGHYVRASTLKLPGSLKNPTSEACLVDDLTDKGLTSIFAVSITDPVAGLVTSMVPTPVAGEVCSGTQIVDVNINGKTLSLAGQTFVAGNGETTGDKYSVIIDTTLDRSDLVRDVIETHDAPLGTFDAGTNRLVASAKEVMGARAYKRVVFATGAVAPIGIDPNATVFQGAALQSAVNDQLKQLVETKVQGALGPATTELQNAFIVGISAGGTQTLFTKLCTTPIEFEGSLLTPGQIFQKTVKRTIEGISLPSVPVSVPCAPDPNVGLSITNVTVGDTVSCDVTFQNGLFAVQMNLPNIHVDAHGYGNAEDTVAGVCVDGVTISGNVYADITDIHLGFNVTEDNLLHNTFSSSNFDAGTTVTAEGNVDVSFCGVGVFCELAAEALNFLSFGAIPDLLHIDFEFAHALDFKEAVGANQPDPVKLNEIRVNEQVVANFDQKVSGIVSEVHITPAGITAGLKGSFATTALDLDVEGTPGITLTPAPVPTMTSMQSQGAKDALIGLSDDTINMMFASLTAAGNLKAGDAQGCFDTGATIGSLLPPDCNALDVGNDLASAGARGYCHAIRNSDCNALSFNGDAFLTSTEQGICHGASGHVCTTISPEGDLLKIGTCLATPNFNLHATQPLLFCAKGDVPPRMLFPNTGAPGAAVPSALRLNDFTVALVVDRTENHVVDGPLVNTGSCFAGPNASDCNVLSACLDLNLNFSMQFLNSCPNGTPGFKSTFDSLQIVTRDIGVVCSGATSPTSDADILNTASDDTITIPIATNAGQLSPDVCGAGLDLGGFVTCAAPQIVAIEADGTVNLRDYLAITCQIK